MASFSIQCEARSWRICFICLCVLSVFLIFAHLFIVLYLKNQTPTKSSTQIKDLHHLCLECQDLMVHPIDDMESLRNFETNGDNKTCCTKDNLQVKHLVHQFLERNHRISKATEGIDFPKCVDHDKGQKPAGRVIGVDQYQTDEEGHLLKWLNNINGSFQNPGVTFTDGQLEIAETGYYWFHSHVTFNDTIFPSEHFAFLHNVFRRPANYPSEKDMKLTEAVIGRCKLLAGFTDRRSFLRDIAYFKKGDRIIVKVSNPEMLSRTPDDSFLEVHLY
ncbi:hypothetical protein CHS0354_038736 [Potamilus streckersoni]|uniref:THD domain-containing protein n=1 Tax=Potamilus streckersoni TaxID=2493646 RepID=A0AAE0SEX3_9BIVA|nr:hypothetical protein CHS0354_038736 [Potamilus streckersoni]